MENRAGHFQAGDCTIKSAALLLLAALAPPCHADDWTREDTYRQAALTALLVVDWGQTRWIAKHNGMTEPDQYPQNAGETNCVLGRYPSIGKVNNYFAASIVGHAAIAYMLPRGWREGWQYVWIGAEANQVNRNRAIGIKIDF